LKGKPAAEPLSERSESKHTGRRVIWNLDFHHRGTETLRYSNLFSASVSLWFIHNLMAAHPLNTGTVPLLVYDGNCGFCARSVQFILRYERRHDLRFVPRDSELGKDLRRRFHLEAVESMLWIADGKAETESGAVLNAAKYVGGIWALLGGIGSIVPPPLRNWAYRLIARNRRRLSSGMKSCFVPTLEQRARFLS